MKRKAEGQLMTLLRFYPPSLRNRAHPPTPPLELATCRPPSLYVTSNSAIKKKEPSELRQLRNESSLVSL